MKDILIIGNFDTNLKAIGGQSLRTRKVADLICRRFGNDAVDILDLSMPNAKAFTLFFMKILRCRQVVLFGGLRSLRIFLILLLIFGKLPTTTIVAIGGWLGELASRDWLIRKIALPRVAHIFVQTLMIRDAVLRSVPNSRVSVMPNFTLSPTDSAEEPDRFVRTPLKVVFLSRICETKGVNLAIGAIRALQMQGSSVTLDIFGPIDNDDTEEALKALLGSGIRYRGIVPNEQVIEVMARYDVLVFPSFHRGEGFPGVIVEAFVSGTPVVCSDWNSNSEVVSHGRTGLVFALEKPGALASALVSLIEDRELLRQLSTNVRAESRKYHAGTATAAFLDHLAARLESSPQPAR